jgi:hypothetical protein
MTAHCLVNFLFVFFARPELDARAPLRLGAAQAGTLEVVGTVLHVRAKFLFHLEAHLRTLEESGDAKAKRVEEFHTSSGC